jgi:Fe-S-cluster containining protein
MNSLEGRLADDDTVSPYPCFCCGVCCARYQVRMTRDEAELIARELGLDWADFFREYLDPAWPSHHTFLARHNERGCVFLEPQSDSRVFFCRIQPFKPADCRDWQASLDKDDCRQGLKELWGLEPDDRGNITGNPAVLEEFRGLLEKLG